MVEIVKLAVAIDGPAGAGKSTIAKLVADKYNLMYINTGAMYRAVALKAVEKGLSPDNVDEICSLIDKMKIKFNGDRLILNDEDITEKLSLPEIAGKVSHFAAIERVREKLVFQQQNIAEEHDVIMDGRDIGTVVLKKAPYKFYITASPEERAQRRYNELMEKGILVDYNDILNEIIKRDHIDTHRKINPLKKASDAVLIDTSNMTISEVVEKICSHINIQ